jgi:hypothetical protein
MTKPQMTRPCARQTNDEAVTGVISLHRWVAYAIRDSLSGSCHA